MLITQPRKKLATQTGLFHPTTPTQRVVKLLRLSAAASLLLGGLLSGVESRAGVPVYLKPESRFPSGQYSHAWLDARTKETQIQRWFRVWIQSSSKYGWIAEDHVLTRLKMSSVARLTRNEPDRSLPQLDSLRGRQIPKGSQAIVLERMGSWSRTRILGENAFNHDCWILNEALERDPSDQIDRAYVFRDAPVWYSSHENAKDKPFDHYSAYQEVIILRALGRRLEVEIDGGTAWLERDRVWLDSDFVFGNRTVVRPLRAGLELRSAPSPDADVVMRLTGTEVMDVLGSKYLRWGKVKVPDHGWLWWPMSEDGSESSTSLPPMLLTTEELVSRSLFDLAASRTMPGVKVASAKGVFKTTDGKSWKKIADFEEKNFPVAMVGSSGVFVGPFFSADQGETFSEWIRWDNLVQSIKTATGLPPNRMRLSALQPLDDIGEKVKLTLDIGRAKPLIVSTMDRGKSFTVNKP